MGLRVRVCVAVLVILRGEAPAGVLARVAFVRLVRALGADRLGGLPGVGVIAALLGPGGELGLARQQLGDWGGQGDGADDGGGGQGLVMEVSQTLGLLPSDGQHLEPLAGSQARVLGGAADLGLSGGLANLM